MDYVLGDNDDHSIPAGSSSSTVSSTNIRCINCTLNITRMRRHTLEIAEVRNVIQRWLASQQEQVQVSNNNMVCHSCWTAAWDEIRQPTNSQRSVGHLNVCISCGCSVLRRRSQILRSDTPRENQIRNVIANQIAPRELPQSAQICHTCWHRTDRQASSLTERDESETSILPAIELQDTDTSNMEPETSTSDSIMLPNYTRAPSTQSRCFFPGCNESNRLIVPSELRVRLFCDYNHYIPADCRICYFHLRSNSWDLLSEALQNPIKTFSAAHIEEFASLLRDNTYVHLDFRNIQNIPDHIVHYYLGFTKEEYIQILNEVPRLTAKHRGALALAAYLIKLRTGDSDERLSALLQIPRSTLERLMNIAREILNQDFVPRHLGLNHITRAEIAQRNLLIPNGLYGREERKPIIIADGTYIYIEKSSNYLYQKQTYSLHKYRNLVKPFLFVCSDGYIIDVFGPYPATTTDADIINQEFSNVISPCRQFFEADDVFILDKGFRDSLELLRSCDYRVFIPLSPQEGETQLSTIDANRSRAVTICRWVVEVVNGIFKTKFKIFRQNYFNRASGHVMMDFSVAAALINRFHPRIRDRPDAAQILEIINTNMDRNNNLADYVRERNFNRIRAEFRNINVDSENVREFPNLTEDDLILIACGTYQLKQARSYYGEHIRFNGCYRIEVCIDRRGSIMEGSIFGPNCKLFRAKIASRHVGRKIYFVYILINMNASGRSAVQEYCCNCIVCNRTVGCCAHVMTVIWYLGWGRHQSYLSAPAQFLDNVLIVYDNEERVTVTSQNVSPGPTTPEQPHSQTQTSQSVTQIGTIRTEEYKRDLAEFQARRSSCKSELHETPVKKKCGRHSLCTDCTTDHDNTFCYERKSALKYKKQSQKRSQSASPEAYCEPLPNIQFLFQNQVFMPGNFFESRSEPRHTKKYHRHKKTPEMKFIEPKQLDFKDEGQIDPAPILFQNNTLSFDLKNFLEGHKTEEEVDGVTAAGDVKVSSQSSSESKDDNSEDKLWEVMSELKHFDQWADEQLKSANSSKSDDNKSDTSAYGLPIVSPSDVDISGDEVCGWMQGKWGVIPVQVKKLRGVTVEHVRKKRNTEINILRKCRHPNVILLMGLYPDVKGNVHLVCETCVGTLYEILHVKGRILSAQTSVQYAVEVANALVFLQMQGYIHSELNSSSIMISSHGAAKLADFGSCLKLQRRKEYNEKKYPVYLTEQQYVSIDGSRTESGTAESEPLISQRSSETYITTHAVAKDYNTYRDSEQFRWHAPELFDPDEASLVYVCSRSDVYSLCLVLWECCNAAVPWKSLNYGKLKELYLTWKTGIRLPHDGTYPGGLLAVLEGGLKIKRSERSDLVTLQTTLHNVKNDINQFEYIIIPARKKKSNFSSVAWDATSPPDSESLSPVQSIEHEALIHNQIKSSTESVKDCSKTDSSPLYETIRRETHIYSVPEKCYISDEDVNVEKLPILKYEHMPEKEYSSACSTPIARLRSRIKDIGTPLHRSDSTEYCSILSPDTRLFELDKEQNSVEGPTAKLSRSFTPKSYKPLHIKVPDYNLDSLKTLPKDTNESRSSYNFDIKNYSLPSTPIARSNKLRKNAWLSGELSVKQLGDNLKASFPAFFNKEEALDEKDVPAEKSATSPDESEASSKDEEQDTSEERSPGIVAERQISDIGRIVQKETKLLAPYESSRESRNSYKFPEYSASARVEDEVLANVNVRPLVAIHERWIYEANRKTGRSMSLPEGIRSETPAVKPASHCVDAWQTSCPQLGPRRSGLYKPRPRHHSPPHRNNGGQFSEQFYQARDTIARSLNLTRDPSRSLSKRSDRDKGTITEELKLDQATDTKGIEDFIREIIRKEFQQFFNEISDEVTTPSSTRTEEVFNKKVANIVEALKNGEDTENFKDDGQDKDQKKETRSFSRVKINGNNKPLLQITFSRSGESRLQVLDNCVNVTICDGKEKLNQSVEDIVSAEDLHANSLKRCQAFSAIQEARSTEDLYIDDDLSTQMQENFGGKVKLIPLHGSLHEILCEKEDECCLIKVKQENGCDTIYFKCDNSDTESRDAIDGVHDKPQDTVVYKRSISLVEERIQRVFPKDKRIPKKTVKEEIKIRPKSEVFIKNIDKDSKILSNSTPSLVVKDKDDVEVNIENVMCYQDSSSDECVKCQVENDDFELIERKIEEDLANSNLSNITCGCLEKISEENLSSIEENVVEKY